MNACMMFYRHFIRIVFILIFCLINLTLTIPTTWGQSSDWSQPVVLSSKDINAWFANITTDSAGMTHIFWASGRYVPENKYGYYDTVVYCQPTIYGCKQTVEVAGLDVVPQDSANARPSAVVDSRGNIHILWHGRDDKILYATAPVREASLAPSWSTPRILSGQERGYYQEIAQSQNDVIHVVWSETTPTLNFKPCPQCSDIFYRQSKDGGQTWSPPIDLSNTPEWGSDKPHIIVAPDGTLYVVWEEGTDFLASQGQAAVSSMLITSYDGGRTWNPPTTFMFPGDTPQSIAVGVDGQGKVIVAWQQITGNGIFFQMSTDKGKSWSAPQPIPGILTRSINNGLDDYDMAADSAGHLHLILTGRTPALVAANIDQNYVYHLEWNGTTWAEPVPISMATGGMPEWPRIAVANGNRLEAVWFERPKGNFWNDQEYTEGARLNIWYTQGKSSASAITPVVWPTITPTPRPKVVVTPTLLPQLTPLPTATLSPGLLYQSVPPGTTEAIYTDMDEILLLVVSLIPAALIIAVVVVSVRFLRR